MYISELKSKKEISDHICTKIEEGNYMSQDATAKTVGESPRFRRNFLIKPLGKSPPLTSNL